MTYFKMWKIFWGILISSAVVHGSRNLSTPIMDFQKLLRSVPDSSNISETCVEHLKEYLQGINNNEGWALKMVDSITKFPDGVLFGHVQIPGHFDECVQEASKNFKGKHCMASLTLNISQQQQDQAPRANSLFLMFRYGICVPSTCSSTDLINLFKEASIDPDIAGFDLTENDCSTDEFRPFRSEDWATVAVLSIIVLTAVCSTTYELIQKFNYKNEKPNPLWCSFSLYNGGRQLFRISQSTAQLKCLHGIRVLSMTWVILGHSYFSYLFGFSVNNAEIPEFIKDRSFVPVSNAFVSVDSFFFLSGLLVCIVFFRDIGKKGSFDVPVAFIHRYIRLTPPFAILMLIQATIISRIGNGPFWNDRTDAVENQCRKSWWMGLLYVQNYLEPTSMCLGQAWYLSADMQMFWVSPLILYPILWLRSYAPYFILLTVLAAAFTNFTVGFVNHLQPNFSINMLGMFSFDQFKLEYVTFHTRMAPWLIGLATGYIICGLQAKKIRFNLSTGWVIIGWAAGLSLLGGSIFGILRFMEHEFTDLEAAFYLSFHRVGWALGLSWVVIACVAGYGGPVNSLLSLDIFQPLGKLSYCNFLVHMTIQSYRMNSMRTNPYLRHFEIVYGYFGDLVASNLLSIPIVLLFEFPFTQIDRYFLQKLEIFPLPKPKKELKLESPEDIKVTSEEPNIAVEKEKPVEFTQDEKNGKVNVAFIET